MNRVVNEKVPVDKAVDEMIARIKAGRRLTLTPSDAGRRADACLDARPCRTIALPAADVGCRRRRRSGACRRGRRGALMLLAPYVARLPGLRRSIRSATGSGWRAIRRATCKLFDDPIFFAHGRQHAGLPDRRDQPQDGGGAVPVGFFVQARAVDQVAVGAVHPAVGGAVDPDHPVGALHAQSRVGRRSTQLIFRLTGEDGPNWLNDRCARAVDGDAGAHLEVAAVLDADPDRRAARDPAASSTRRRSVDGATGVAEVPASSPGRRCARSTSRRRSCR